MTNPQLSIALVNTSADRGGAGQIARQLLHGFRRSGHDAWLLVGRGEAEKPHILGFPSDIRTRAAHLLAGPGRLVDRRLGLETYRYPATQRMLKVLPRSPDLIHLHNLHGGYFDLRALSDLSASLPVAITLHDAWLLSGHCAHSLGCERWRIGCGSCPDLDIYPSVQRDATARNWTRKRDIFLNSRLHVATPSTWLADKVRDSILASGLADLKVIPNGVDLEIFRPRDPRAARAELGIPPEETVLLFVGSDGGPSGFKDLTTAEEAAARAAAHLDRELALVVLGAEAPERRKGRARIRFVPFQSDPATVARYYQAADLHLHAARADTFPSTVLEALACGTPVVATSVGGIPEQIRTLPLPGAEPSPGKKATGPDGATGVLTPRGEEDAMAAAIVRLLENEPLRDELGKNARRDAESRFDATVQCHAYLDWFRTILAGRSSKERSERQ